MCSVYLMSAEAGTGEHTEKNTFAHAAIAKHMIKVELNQESYLYSEIELDLKAMLKFEVNNTLYNHIYNICNKSQI